MSGKGGPPGRRGGRAAERVYAALCAVPPGRVTTYGELARAAGMAGGQRAVGRMMRDNPYPGIVPCHRVVMSDGRVGGYAHGTPRKEAMLAGEGVEVRGGRVVDFARGRFLPLGG